MFESGYQGSRFPAAVFTALINSNLLITLIYKYILFQTTSPTG